MQKTYVSAIKLKRYWWQVDWKNKDENVRYKRGEISVLRLSTFTFSLVWEGKVAVRDPGAPLLYVDAASLSRSRFRVQPHLVSRSGGFFFSFFFRLSFFFPIFRAVRRSLPRRWCVGPSATFFFSFLMYVYVGVPSLPFHSLPCFHVVWRYVDVSCKQNTWRGVCLFRDISLEWLV